MNNDFPEYNYPSCQGNEEQITHPPAWPFKKKYEEIQVGLKNDERLMEECLEKYRKKFIKNEIRNARKRKHG
jgi:hypothetical protein